MAIVNFKIRELTGEKKPGKNKSIDVKANSGITGLTRGSQDKIGDYIEAHYTYDVEYEPGVGSLSLKGTLWYVGKDLEEEITEEDATIELPVEAIQEISTAIIQNCLLESLDIARKLQLPPPMNMPKVVVKPKQRKFKKVEPVGDAS